MKATRNLTFGAILTALSVLFLYAASILPTMKLALIFLASFMPIILVIECNSKRYALISGVATAIIGLFIVKMQGVVLIGMVMYCAFFSYYPALKSVLENQKNRVLEWVLKEIVFVTVSVILYFVAKSFNIDILNPVMFLVGFNIYDVILTLAIRVYLEKISPIIRKNIS